MYDLLWFYYNDGHGQVDKQTEKLKLIVYIIWEVVNLIIITPLPTLLVCAKARHRTSVLWLAKPLVTRQQIRFSFVEPVTNKDQNGILRNEKVYQKPN